MGTEPALLRMLRAGGDEGHRLDQALDAMAEVFARPATAKRIGPHFTCPEANRIALVLYVSHHTDAACVWLDAHAASDDEGDVHGGDAFDASRYLRAALG